MNKIFVKMSMKEENIKFSKMILIGFLEVQLEHSLESNVINELKTALSEAVTNAIIHSNGTTIDLELDYDEKFIYISVKDNGCGIENIEKAKEPMYSSCKNEKRAGLGFTIMEVFCDELIVENKDGLIVKMKKRYC